MTYIKRTIKKHIKELQKGFPVISISGARQTGKTTFLKQNFPQYKYFNLENPSTLNLFKANTTELLESNKNGIIIDEVQKFPEILSYIQSFVDEHKILGKVIISGSQNLLIHDKVSQSLAGRVAHINMLPFSISEIPVHKTNTYKQIFKGFYPTIYDREISPTNFYNQYISTFIERDIRLISNITNLNTFKDFMALLASRTGQVINYKSLADDVGVSDNTIKNWISLLESSFIVFTLQPYYKNISKRVIKSPKIYFYDTGILVRLSNIQSPEQLQTHFNRGGIFENLIISEIKKYILNNQLNHNLFFYQESNKNSEIDLLIETSKNLYPIEIKSASNYNTKFTKNINKFIKNYENLTNKQQHAVIYNGTDTLETNHGGVYNFQTLNNLFPKIS